MRELNLCEVAQVGGGGKLNWIDVCAAAIGGFIAVAAYSVLGPLCGLLVVGALALGVYAIYDDDEFMIKIKAYIKEFAAKL